MSRTAGDDQELTSATWDALRRASSASLSSELLRQGFRNTFMSGVKPLPGTSRLVGYAFTLRYVPAREDLDFHVDYDNLRDPQRLAVEAIGDDEVLVIDARGEREAASFGHILTTRILRRGAAGLVTDGALRDAGRIAECGLPVYCGGVHATTSSTRHHAADMNVPVGCGGVAVYPGDVIVGDEDGVVVIPRALAADIADAALEREQLEQYILGRVDDGESILGVYPPDADTLAGYQASTENGPAGG